MVPFFFWEDTLSDQILHINKDRFEFQGGPNPIKTMLGTPAPGGVATRLRSGNERILTYTTYFTQQTWPAFAFELVPSIHWETGVFMFTRVLFPRSVRDIKSKIR